VDVMRREGRVGGKMAIIIGGTFLEYIYTIYIYTCIYIDHMKFAVYMAVSFTPILPYDFGSVFKHYTCGCMLCMLLFNFVNCVFLMLCIIMYSYCYVLVRVLQCYVLLLLYVDIFLLLCIVMYSCYYVNVFLLVCIFCSVCSVSLCCSVYCLCVNVYRTAATGISGHFSTTLTEVLP
jgi:hypothetical protein